MRFNPHLFRKITCAHLDGPRRADSAAPAGHEFCTAFSIACSMFCLASGFNRSPGRPGVLFLLLSSRLTTVAPSKRVGYLSIRGLKLRIRVLEFGVISQPLETMQTPLEIGNICYNLLLPDILRRRHFYLKIPESSACD